MNPEELDKALYRAIGNVFHLHESMIPIFRNILTSYPLRKIESMKQGELKRLLYRLSNRKDVQEMHDWIDLEIESGEQKIDTAVYGIILQSLENAGIISKDELSRIKDYSAQEVWAYSCPPGKEPELIARGQFPIDTSLDELIFTPDNVFYSDEDLEWKIRPGEKPALILSEDVSLRRVSRLSVFEKEIRYKEAVRITKDLIRYMVNNYSREKIRENDYQILRNKLVKSLIPMFPSVLRETRAINIQELLKILKQVRRRNINLYQHIPDSAFVGTLTKGIELLVPAPYAVIKTRIKQRKTAFDKIIQSFYDLREGGYKGGPKEFRDLFGIRVLLPTVDDIFKYANQLDTTPGIEILQEKNMIGKLKKLSGYESYHKTIKFAGIVYDLQLRTHEMDERAETDPRQAHHTYKKEIRKLIDSTPLNVRKVVSVCLNLPPPSE